MKKYLSLFKVSIIGVGLIGGSFGLALKKKRLVGQVVGIGRHIHKLKEAKRLGAIDTYTTDFGKGVKDSDVVMIATPVSKIPLIVTRILPYLKDGCIITDVGSTKEKVVKEVQEILSKSSGKGRKPKVSFIGGHPMAGSEKQGVRNARADIFSGTTCILTPADKNGRKVVKIVRNLWERMGARILLLKPEEHDYLVAYTSHLPHVLASTLANLIGRVRKKDPRASRIIAGSISDMTRIAASNPEMWIDICLSNSKAISESINVTVKNLEKFKRSIEKKRKKELQDLFHEGRLVRRKLIKS
ncbi:MAG: prephenate dehydrogenase [bacterium]